MGKTSAPGTAAAAWAAAAVLLGVPLAAADTTAARDDSPPPGHGEPSTADPQSPDPQNQGAAAPFPADASGPPAAAPGVSAPGVPLAPPSAPTPAPPPALAPAPADTRAATALLREAVLVRPGGRHHRLLRALRFLEDPELAPLFRRLREDEHAALRVHGLLGSAELATPRGVTTENLVDLERDDQRAEVISAALDGGLLGERTLDELLAWPGLDNGVKLLLATPRAADGRVADGSPAHRAMLAALGPPHAVGRGAAGPAPAAGSGRGGQHPVAPAKDLARRGLAALLLHHTGDPRGTQGLIALNNSGLPARDAVRATLLETARRHGLNRAGTWAYSIASEPDLPPRLGELALKVAAGFGDARAHRRWGEQVVAAREDLPRRTRLALTGLAFAAVARPGVFNAVAIDGDPFVAAVGRAARAVAAASAAAGGARAAAVAGPAAAAASDAGAPTGATAGAATAQPDPPAALASALDDLHATDHPLAHAWLARFAADPASPDTAATAAAERLVRGYRPGHPTGRTRRLQAVLDAVETLLRRDPAAAARVVPAVLGAADTPPACAQAVLLGLIRSRTPAARALAQTVAVPDDPDARALALVLRLRSGGPLETSQRSTLTRVLQGQTNLDDELRVQAAWAYLKRTAGADAASTLTDADPSAMAQTRNAP